MFDGVFVKVEFRNSSKFKVLVGTQLFIEVVIFTAGHALVEQNTLKKAPA